MSRPVRTALTSLLVICLALLPAIWDAAGASAATAGNSSKINVSTSTFIAYATTSPTGVNPNGGPLVMSNSTGAQYFYIRNTGSTALSMVTLSLTYTSAPAKTAFYRCDAGVAFSSLNTCASGSRTTVNASVALSLSMQPGTWYAFELDPKRLTTPTVAVSVSSTQIRSPITTNS